MVKRLELDIESCYYCPYVGLDEDTLNYFCYLKSGITIYSENVVKIIHKDCPLKDKEN